MSELRGIDIALAGFCLVIGVCILLEIINKMSGGSYD